MALKEQINNDLKTALLGGDRFKGDVLRGLKAVILNEEVAKGLRESGVSDEVIEQLITKEVKKRNESAEIYKSAGRAELVENELKEAEILSLYLPKQMSEEEVMAVINEEISKLDDKTMKVMGQVIGLVKSKLGNSADGALIARLVKNALS